MKILNSSNCRLSSSNPLMARGVVIVVNAIGVWYPHTTENNRVLGKSRYIYIRQYTTTGILLSYYQKYLLGRWKTRDATLLVTWVPSLSLWLQLHR